MPDKIKIAFVFQLCFVMVMKSQTTIESKSIATSIFLGVPFSTSTYPSITISSLDKIDRSLNPVVTIGCELRIPLISTLGCTISGTSEIGYSRLVPASKLRVFFGTSGQGTIDGFIQRIPILVGVNIRSETTLSPFILAGLGTALTRYNHSVSIDNGFSFDTSAWQFCWGAGGGLHYQLNDNVGFEIFAKGWVTESNLTEQVPNEVIGIVGRFAVITYGFATVISI